MNSFDVVIVGGGPAGSTLAALLAKSSDLKVAVCEKARFPREHVGESFSHRIIGVLEESGALPKVLASECWIKKYGGYYAWDPEKPSIAFFDQPGFEKDGVHRWSMHVNRPEFDQILFEHAKSLGAVAFEETSVEEIVLSSDEHHELLLSGGRSIRSKYVVEATGRGSKKLVGRDTGWLSDFKNVGIWGHFLGAQAAYELDAPWNVFRKNQLSPIGSFAFDNGWFWYIPVPKVVDGRRVTTTSIGLITDGEVVRDHPQNLRDPDAFLALARTVPLLSELIRDELRLVDNELSTATNYSRISDRFCDHDERWIAIGDSAYFVDPLFSSGVAFGMIHAQAAALLLRSTLFASELQLTQGQVDALWADYDNSLRRVAKSFALGIDHWYHAIAEKNPSSVYWRRRSSADRGSFLNTSFQNLVDADFALPPDLRAVLGEANDASGSTALNTLIERNAKLLPGKGERVRYLKDVQLRESVSLAVGATKGAPFPGEPGDAASEFWLDPVAHGPKLRSRIERPLVASRFESDGSSVQAPRTPGLQKMHRALSEGSSTFGEIAARLAPNELRVLVDLIRSGLVGAVSAETRLRAQ